MALWLGVFGHVKQKLKQWSDCNALVFRSLYIAFNNSLYIAEVQTIYVAKACI